MTVIKAQKRPGKTRVALLIPRTLFDRIYKRAEKHIPKPYKAVFIKFLLELAIEEYVAERRVIKKGYIFRGKRTELNHFIESDIMQPFNELFAAHRPPAHKQDFLSYMLALGLQKYEKLYNQYGFLKEDD